MASNKPDSGDGRDGRYNLSLYVTGMTPRSSRAIQNIRRICEEHLAHRYDLAVIDLYQAPALAREQEIVAAPTLVKRRPLPVRRIVGDLSDTARVLGGLGVPPIVD
jgi:circadian clock protein KaiB